MKAFLILICFTLVPVIIACSADDAEDTTPRISFSVNKVSYAVKAGITEHDSIPSCAATTNSGGFLGIFGIALPSPLPAGQAFSNVSAFDLCQLIIPPNAPGDQPGTGILTNAQLTHYWTEGEQQWRIRSDKYMTAEILVLGEIGGFVSGTLSATNIQISVRSNKGEGYVHIASDQTLTGSFRLKRFLDNDPNLPD